MMTMDHFGTSAGDSNKDGEQRDYIQMAWLLREKLNDLVDGDKGEFSELGLRSLLDMAVSRNIISMDPKVLNPVLWRTLPKELLFLVLARLPMPDIIRLRSLSKEWRIDMATVNSGINQACDEANPTMIACYSCKDIMVEGFPFPEFLVTIYTQMLQYSYHLRLGDTNPGEIRWNDMGASDGGLVCFVSTWEPTKAKPLCIVVANLLTQVQRKLPPLQYVYSTPPKMMHIEVDSITKCYRVVVIGKNMKGRPTVEIYHSEVKQWTKTMPSVGYIFGVIHIWEYEDRYCNFKSINTTASVFDFATGKLHGCVEKGALNTICPVITIQKDSKFVLEYTSDDEILATDLFCITKYRMQNNAEDWIQERSYLWPPSEVLVRTWPLSEVLMKRCFPWRWTLKACEGFLMAFPISSDNNEDVWLLNLATGVWKSLPNYFEGHKHIFLMSRAFWNVMP